MKTQFLKLPLLLLVMIVAVVACNKDELRLNQSEIALQDAAKVIRYTSDVIPNQYIVVMDEAAVSSSLRSAPSYPEAKQMMMTEARQMLRNHRLSNKEIMMTYAASIKGFVANLTDEEALEVASDPKVSYVEQDRILRLAGGPPWAGGGGGGGCSPDTGECDGTCLYSNSGEVPWGIQAVNGGSAYSGSGRAWVIDSGIDLDHEDLNVTQNTDLHFVAPDMKGRDGKSADDGNGHGTHVAGTIAALSNGIGVVGVAPGATVIPVKVLSSSGSGSTSGVIAGVEFVGANGVSGDVANMSLGGGTSTALDDAVIAASSNVIFTLAAGNDGQDANNSSPARAEGDNVYTISAVDCALNFAYFSNWGSAVDYAAPGVSILSTTPDNTYSSYSGTSMAAPHAAGVFLRTNNPGNNGTVRCGDTCDSNPDTIISL